MLKAISEAFVFDGSDYWAWQMRCPMCGFECAHHGHVQVYLRPEGEDAQTIVATIASEEVVESDYNPSPRRGAVSVFFSGECGHEWVLTFVQHKGNTFIQFDEIPPSKDELKAMPYQDYLQTDHWKRTRAAAIERAGGACQLCNRSAELHVHHRTYERRGEELPSDLTVLCKGCHERFHGVVNGKVTHTVSVR